MSAEDAPRLFMIYVGGMAEGCHVELHDVRFSAGKTIEDCYEDLINQWWGIPDSLHLDCWGTVQWADGHDVALKDTPQKTELKLWFVNLGGYDPQQFTELHENLVVVAEEASEAKKKAMAHIDDWDSPHKDNILDVEAVLDVSSLLSKKGLHIHLTPSDKQDVPFQFEARYVPFVRMMKHEQVS
jgi:hypothetical protein